MSKGSDKRARAVLERIRVLITDPSIDWIWPHMLESIPVFRVHLIRRSSAPRFSRSDVSRGLSLAVKAGLLRRLCRIGSGGAKNYQIIRHHIGEL